MLNLGNVPAPRRIVLREGVGKEGEPGFEPEAWIVMAPIDQPMRRRAQRAARALVGEIDDIADVDLDVLIDVGEKASRELIRLGAIEWGGIGEDGSDAPLDLTPDRKTRMDTCNDPERPTGTIDRLLADEDLFALLDREYVAPDAKRRAEKNGSSASPSGTGGAGTRANTTASSAAGPKRKGAAKPARTASTRSKRTKGKASGTS